MKHIGVVSHLRLPDLPAELKRYAFFFDEVQIVGMSLEEARKKYHFLDPQAAAEIEFLYGARFLAEGKLELHSASSLKSDLAREYLVTAAKTGIAAQYLEKTYEIDKMMQDVLQLIREGKEQGQDTGPLVTLYNKFAEFSAIAMVEGLKAFPLSARQVALNLSLYENQKAVCIGELEYRSAGEDAGAVSQDTIYEIAVDGLPIPELTSWQEILEFKDQTEIQQRLLAFHVWVSDISKVGLTKVDMTDKIGHLKNEYIEALKVAKKSHYPGFFRCLLVGTAALVENCAKFRGKDLAEGAFKISETTGRLLEAERNAPGRELSYLIEVSKSIRT